MNKELVMPIVRHALQIVGGVLVAKGVVDADTSGQLIDLTVTATGAILSIVTLVWMVKSKKKEQNEA